MTSSDRRFDSDLGNLRLRWYVHFLGSWAPHNHCWDEVVAELEVLFDLSPEAVTTAIRRFWDVQRPAPHQLYFFRKDKRQEFVTYLRGNGVQEQADLLERAVSVVAVQESAL